MFHIGDKVRIDVGEDGETFGIPMYIVEKMKALEPCTILWAEKEGCNYHLVEDTGLRYWDKSVLKPHFEDPDWEV